MVNGSDAAIADGTSQPAHWGFWATVLWAAAIFGIFMVLQGLTMLGIVLQQNPHVPPAQMPALIDAASRNGIVLSITTLVTTTLCCALIAGVIKLKKGAAVADYLAIRAVPSCVMLKWLTMLVAVVVASDAFTTLVMHRPIVPEFVSSIYATAHPRWILWVTLVLVAPLFEETFFRGFLFKGLQSSFVGPIGAVVLTAGLWAVVHSQYDTYYVITVFILGLPLGIARLSTRSILIPLGLHAAANIIAAVEAAVWGAGVAT